MNGPRIVVVPPGPKSLKIWEEAKKYITPGLSVNPVLLRGMKSRSKCSGAIYGTIVG